MNPLKSLFGQVFESAHRTEASDESRQETAFEWNPDLEVVAPTSAKTFSWERGALAGEPVLGAHAEGSPSRVAPSTPGFEKSSSVSSPPAAAQEWVRPSVPSRPAAVESRQELDTFVAEKREEMERLGREIKEAEQRFAELQERRRVEGRPLLAISDHLAKEPATAPDEGVPVGSPALLRPQGA